MKILCLGDVVAASGVDALCARLNSLRRSTNADVVIVNGENASLGFGNGISRDDAERLFSAGADVITGGNHSFRQKNVYAMLDDCDTLLRPANFPAANPGKGVCLASLSGRNILVVNLAGRADMDPCDCPFAVCRRILAEYKGRYDFAVADFHAEATGEKIAFAHAFKNDFSIIFGTHTHVPTADEQILGGCGYITDLGMCGPSDSVLGVKPEIIIRKLETGMPCKFEPENSPAVIEGALVTLSSFNFRCTSVERIKA